MAKSITRRIVRWSERPLVLLSGLSPEIIRGTIELARDWSWDLRSGWITPGEWPADKPVAGVLIGEQEADPLAQQLRKRTCPVVRLGSTLHAGIVPAVLPDLAAAGRLAAKHFAVRGFKEVAYVGFDPLHPSADSYPMCRAFIQGAEEAGMRFRVRSVKEKRGDSLQGKHEKRIAALAAWLGGLPKPLGVFTYDDLMATRILIACSRAGLAVPEEVSVLGYGNTMQCELTAVGLSSVDPADDERMRTALDLLHRLMEGKPAPRKTILVPPRGIVERRSTDVLAVPDMAVARAVRFIWDHFTEDLSIRDIASASGMKQRTLERGFRQYLDRSVHAELARKRVTELHRLLRETDAPLADLIAYAGYFTLANAHKSFKRVYGISPRKFRALHRNSP